MRRLLVLIALTPALLRADDSERILTLDHFVRVKSTVPAIAGETAQIYVRERVQAGRALRGIAAGERNYLAAGIGTERGQLHGAPVIAPDYPQSDHGSTLRGVESAMPGMDLG